MFQTCKSVAWIEVPASKPFRVVECQGYPCWNAVVTMPAPEQLGWKYTRIFIVKR